MRISATLWALVVFLVWGCPVCIADETLPLVNGDFSTVKDGKPAGWKLMGESGGHTLECVGADGRHCAKLTCKVAKEVGKRIADAYMVQNLGFTMKRWDAFEVSIRARMEGSEPGSFHLEFEGGSSYFHKVFAATDQWQVFQTTFRLSKGSVDPGERIELWLRNPGTLYVSNVRIKRLDAAVKFSQQMLIQPSRGKNLVWNGAFGAGPNGWSTFGRYVTGGNLENLHGTIESGDSPVGRNFLRVRMGGEYAESLLELSGSSIGKEVRQDNAWAANLGWIPVEKDAPYTLSAWMRASQSKCFPILGIRYCVKPEEKTEQWLPHFVQLGNCWQEFSFTFKAPSDYCYVLVGPSWDRPERLDVDIAGIQLEKGAAATEFEPHLPVEIGVEPTQPGGIFEMGEPLKLAVGGFNYADRPVSVELRLRAEDFFDDDAPLPSLNLKMHAKSGVRQEIDLPAAWRGVYTISTEYTVEGQKHSQKIRLAVVPKRTVRDTIVGVNHPFVTDYLTKLAQKSGLNWFRLWSAYWQAVEPEKGKYTWEFMDKYYERPLRNGAKVVALLPVAASSQWASEAPESSDKKTLPTREAWAPKDPKDLENFTAEVSRRYAGRIAAWEFLNEPLFAQYSLLSPLGMKRQGWVGAKGYTPADYVRLLKYACDGMKRGNPDCRVIGGMSAQPDNYWELNRQCIEAGALQYLDIYNLHIYPRAAPEELLPALDNLLALMDQHGGRKPLWITEVGYYGMDNPSRSPFYPVDWNWGEAEAMQDERTAAEYTIRLFGILLARSAEKLFIHSAFASWSPNSRRVQCPFFDYGGAPRKMLPAVALFSKLMGDRPKYIGQSVGGGNYCFAFETPERCLVMLWTTGKEKTLPSSIAGAKAMDIMGNLRKQPLTISESPLYLLGGAGKSQAVLGAVKAGLSKLR